MVLTRSLLAGAAASVLFAAGAMAAEPLVAPIIVDPVIDYAAPSPFEGFYAGFYLGGILNPENNYHYNYGNGWHDNRFAVGLLAGYNFSISEGFLAGVELQGGANFNSSDDYGMDAFALGRLGFVPTDDLLLYASGGFGVMEGVPSYALGVGAEFHLGSGIGLRTDLLAIGGFGDFTNQDGYAGPDLDLNGFTAAKATVGVIWHM